MDFQDPTIVVFVARHGTTVLNAAGRFRGKLNPDLDEKGIRDAHKLAKLFSNIDLSYIICSDKTRAVHTADIIAQPKQIQVHHTEELRALNVGDFSGVKRTAETEAQLEVFLSQPDCPIPGGESLNDFKSRIQPCIKEAVDLYQDTGVPPLIVAHSSIIHEVGSMIYGEHKSVLVEPGGVLAIYYRDGKLGASPIFKPANKPAGNRSDTVS